MKHNKAHETMIDIINDIKSDELFRDTESLNAEYT